jgi:serine/threonine protein kinase
MIVSQPTLEPLRRWDPDRIGPYTVTGRLGAGAMGQVYLGRSTAGRLVAVKTIKIELAEEPGFRLRFAREVAAARRVSGVFTAAVVAADPEAEMPWLATAYVPAPTLSRLVRVCGPLPVPTVRWLAAGCAEALESIHLAGLVHRDLKPSNVLVAPDGPRVIDFGVARAAERIQLTATRGAVGTPAYMAPEQARDSQRASLASDVYSLGATLLFAATGHGPYHGETVMDVLVKLATELPDLSGLPSDLTTLIEACLERSPRMRPTSAALLAGLGSFVEATADPADAHSYLPDSAMALIGEYQRSPQPAAVQQTGPDPDSEDPTSASHTALPASFTPPVSHRRRKQTPPRKGANGAALTPASHPHGLQRPQARAALIVAGVVAGAAMLAIGGAYLGPKIDPGLSRPSANATAPALDPPPGGNPPQNPADGTSTIPRLTMGQTFGDGNSGFQVHGSGFVPHTVIILSLNGREAASAKDEPVTDPRGTFNYTIDQGHVFFPQEIPDGTYHVVAKAASGGQQASATFLVQAPRGPPATGPPSQGLTHGTFASPSAAASRAAAVALPVPSAAATGAGTAVPSPSSTPCTHGACCAHGACRYRS